METTIATTDNAAVSEAAMLASEMAKAYKRQVEFYRREMGLSPADADAKALELIVGCPPEVWQRLANDPAQSVTWFDLNTLAEHDQDAAYRRWAEIKQAARGELESGVAAYEAIKAFNNSGITSPWDRARFAAIRSALLESWAPVSGVEGILIDSMAQAQTMCCYWLEALGNYTALNQLQSKPKRGSNDDWQPPHVSTHEALEQAASMIDRFNRLFLRTLRQLRDLRRYSAPLTIQGAQQVNIGGQQVNVVTAGTKPEPSSESLANSQVLEGQARASAQS